MSPEHGKAIGSLMLDGLRVRGAQAPGARLAGRITLKSHHLDMEGSTLVLDKLKAAPLRDILTLKLMSSGPRVIPAQNP